MIDARGSTFGLAHIDRLAVLVLEDDSLELRARANVRSFVDCWHFIQINECRAQSTGKYKCPFIRRKLQLRT
jgi:hypothetical protein